LEYKPNKNKSQNESDFGEIAFKGGRGESRCGPGEEPRERRPTIGWVGKNNPPRDRDHARIKGEKKPVGQYPEMEMVERSGKGVPFGDPEKSEKANKIEKKKRSVNAVEQNSLQEEHSRRQKIFFVSVMDWN